MKKFAYIILIIAILVVISHFVKQNDTNNAPATVEEAAIVVDETNTANTPANSENTTPAENTVPAALPEGAAIAEDADVVDVQEDIIIEDQAPEEDDALEVEETDPSQTAEEDETIIKE